MKKNSRLSFDPIRIKQLRETRGLSQSFVSQQLGISQSSYNDIEQGRTKLRADFLPLLTTCFNVDIRCFFEQNLAVSEQIKVMEEIEKLKQECQRLRDENKEVNRAMSELRQIHLAAIKNNEGLLISVQKRLKEKKFFINLLLFFSLMILFIYCVDTVIRG